MDTRIGIEWMTWQKSEKDGGDCSLIKNARYDRLEIGVGKRGWRSRKKMKNKTSLLQFEKYCTCENLNPRPFHFLFSSWTLDQNPLSFFRLLLFIGEGKNTLNLLCNWHAAFDWLLGGVLSAKNILEWIFMSNWTLGGFTKIFPR